jgi:hypothetical protein
MKQSRDTLRSVAIVAVSVALLFGANFCMQSNVLIDGEPSLGWLNMINLQHNAFHSWRFGHFTQVASMMIPAAIVAERSLVSILILVIGTAILLKTSRQSDESFFSSSLAYALPSLGVLLSVGVDPLIFGTLSWMPIMVAVSIAILHKPDSILLWTILGAISIENSLCANQLSTVSVVVGLWLASLLQHPPPSTRGSSQSSQTWCWLWVVLLGPALITTLISPLPFLPHYPKSAHIITYESPIGYIQPLIGPAYPFAVLDRFAVTELYGFHSQLLLGLAGALLLLARVRSNVILRRVTFGGLGVALLATLDTTLPEDLAIIAPIASISRLLPWGTTLSLTSLAVALAAFLLGYVIATNRCPRSSILGAAAALAILCGPSASELYKPYLRKANLINDPNLARVLRTPSASLVRMLISGGNDPETLLHKITTLADLPTTPASELQATISISPAPSEKAINDARSLETVFRWSPRTGNQRGLETLTIRFPSALEVHGVELQPGAYASDYPRGLLITGGRCDSPEQATALYEARVWQGSLEATGRGIPYLTPRNKVRVMFTQSATVECIFAHQTGHASFDWSITSVGIIR